MFHRPLLRPINRQMVGANLPTKSKDTIFNPQLPKTTRAGRSIPSCPYFIRSGGPGRLFRIGPGCSRLVPTDSGWFRLIPAGSLLFPAVSPQGVCRNSARSVRRPRRYSRKWFCSLQVSANSRSERRWWRIISATPSSSCSRTRRSSSRCSWKTSSCGTVQTR